MKPDIPLRLIFIFAATLILTAPFPAWPAETQYGDWADCALDQIPGVKSDETAELILENCKKGYRAPRMKTGGGCGEYSIDDCVKAHAKEEESEKAMAIIFEACGKHHPPAMKMNPSYLK